MKSAGTDAPFKNLVPSAWSSKELITAKAIFMFLCPLYGIYLQCSTGL